MLRGLVAHQFESVAAFEQGLTFRRQALEFDGFDLAPVLFPLQTALRLFVIIELGSIRLAARWNRLTVDQSRSSRSGSRRVSESVATRASKISAIAPATRWPSGRVLDQVRPRRGESHRAEVLARHARLGRSDAGVRKRCARSWSAPSVWTAPVAAFWAPEPAGGPDLHPEQSAGPQRQRRRAKADDFASRCKGAQRPAENRRLQPLPVRAVCRPIAPLEGPRRGSCRRCTAIRSASASSSRVPRPPGYAASSWKRGTSSGVSCTRT